MKTSRIAWCLAIAMVAGCTDQVTEPVEQEVQITEPSAKAVHIGFEQEQYRNDVWFYTCLDENVWERGRVKVYKGRVFSSSGNANRWTMGVDYYGLPEDDLDYFGEEFTLLGLSSGDVWTFDKASNSHTRNHQTKDGFYLHMTSNMWFTNQDDEKFHLKEIYKLKCPWEGEECSLEQWKGGCLVDLPR